MIRKLMPLACVSALTSSLLLTPLAEAANAPAGPKTQTPQAGKKFQSRETFPHQAGELLVKMKPGAARVQDGAIARSRGFKIPPGLENQDISRWRLVSVQAGQDLRAVKARLQKNPNVEAVEYNYTLTASLTPNDPQFYELWGLHNEGQVGGYPDADIDAPEAWNLTTGSPEVVVGVIDTGIDYTHPDLVDNVWTNPGEIPGNGIDDDGNGYIDDLHGYDFVNQDGDPFDDHYHGTHVAGTIAAKGNNGLGVAGVAWNTKVMALKFLDASGSGSTVAAIDAVLYATAMNADLTSNSWGGGGYSQALADAIAANGRLFVAAAGNSAMNNDVSPQYPSSYELPNILAVAATESGDGLATFSNYGASSVDVAAPGQFILSTAPGGGYQSLSGTSMATPHVAGVAALLLSKFPGMPADLLRSRILESVDALPNLSGKVLSGGRLNAFNALEDDTLPPAPVSGLTVIDAGATSLTLDWIASGDDGYAGAASAYRIYYSTDWFDASQLDQISYREVPSTTPAGVPFGPYPLQGLMPETFYTLRIVAVDNVGNISPLSSEATAQTQPAQFSFADSFENGLVQWTLEGSDGNGGGPLWHLTQHKFSSPGNALYYGIAGTFTYNTGQANLGSATSASFIVPADAVLSFQHSLTSESTTPYDEATVQIAVANGPWQVIALLDDAPAMTPVAIDLSPYAGQLAQLRFGFDTKDPIANDFEGWIIDDVMVLGGGAADTTPPAMIYDLYPLGVQGSQVDLQWTAPGDDGISGTALAYELRYASAPIDDSTFDSASPIEVPLAPQPASYLETFTIPEGLLPQGEVFLAIRAVDDAGNVGPVGPSVPVLIDPGFPVVLFDDPISSGAQWSYSGSDGTGLWHISDHRSNSPFQALYYGIPGQLNYDTGAANWGVAESPVINLAGTHGAKLSFVDYREAEQGGYYDKSTVEVGVAGVWTEVYSADYVTTQMTPREVDLSAFDGQPIQVRFRFDTVDAVANLYEGWVIDDVRVTAMTDTPMPIAQIWAVTEAMVNEPVLLDGSGSFSPAGKPLTYSWVVDGVPLPDQGDSLWTSFPGAGGHLVQLIVSDGVDTATATHLITIVNVAPVATISGPTTGIRYAPLSFDGSGSFDGNGDPLSMTWSVDGVPAASGPNLTQAFTTLGDHKVSLTVFDGNDTATADQIVSIVNQAPAVSIDGPLSGNKGEPLTFTSTAGDPDGDPLTYQWFVDGLLTSTADTLGHSFTSAGDHQLLLAVSDGVDSASASLTITITNQAPLAQISGPTSAQVGEPLTFDGSGSSDPDGDALSYSWIVDGAPAGAAALQSWTFEQSGTHAVSLTVSDGVDTHTTTLSVVVDALPPVASAGSDQTVKQRSWVTLDASASYDPQGGAVGYQWQQLSGTPVLIDAATSATPTFEAPALKRVEFETLVFEVVVQGADGATASDSVTVTVVKKL